MWVRRVNPALGAGSRRRLVLKDAGRRARFFRCRAAARRGFSRGTRRHDGTVDQRSTTDAAIPFPMFAG